MEMTSFDEPKRETELQRELNFLTFSTKMLEDAVNRLEKRLEPITRNESVVDKETFETKARYTDITRIIGIATDGINFNISRISKLLDRIEL